MIAARVLVLHGYSSVNRGDGLLVDESLQLIREVYGNEVKIDLVTSYPDSFSYTGLNTFCSKPSYLGYQIHYLRLLATKFSGYDLVVGVGGGYLRFGTPVESIKTLLVMGPQLLAAAGSRARTVYLPQSIGPARFGFHRPLQFLLKQLDHVWVRDNRSLQQFRDAEVARASDLALLAMNRRPLIYDNAALPVISVREHRGGVPEQAVLLAGLVGDFDGYVQSAVAGNDDGAAVKSLSPAKVCTFEEFIEAPVSARVVVAVRLHAALMAIQAGHYVVHLAYERKGFGAFEDLGLGEYVFNVHNFDPAEVNHLVNALMGNAAVRDNYDKQIAAASDVIQQSRRQVLKSLSAQSVPYVGDRK